MSDAEEMLLASVNRHRDAPDQAKAGPETSAAASMSMSKPDDSVAASGVEPLSGQETSPATPTSQASRPFHEGDHVRNGRLSTSDARKADHKLSSTIVALSSDTVGSENSLGYHLASRRVSWLHAAFPTSANVCPTVGLVLQVFNEKHASSHLGIPFGALITPALPYRPEKAQHEPVCCSSCDAYLNMYSEVRKSQMWRRTHLRAAKSGCQVSEGWHLHICRLTSKADIGNANSAATAIAMRGLSLSWTHR